MVCCKQINCARGTYAAFNVDVDTFICDIYVIRTVAPWPRPRARGVRLQCCPHHSSNTVAVVVLVVVRSSSSCSSSSSFDWESITV